MAPHLSRELRERIIVWHYEPHKKAPEIATLAGCTVHTVYNVLALHRDFGSIDNPFARTRGRSRALDIGDMNYLASLLNAHPKIYLDELQADLASTRDLEVSLATISHALRHLAVSHKKVSAAATERNELLRAMWQYEHTLFGLMKQVLMIEPTNDQMVGHGLDRLVSLAKHSFAVSAIQSYQL